MAGRDRRIFEGRRLAGDPIPLAELAVEFGVSRERVRQIEVRAFEKVQKAVKNRSARRISIDHPKLEKIAGDALEMATVKRALSGVDVVIQSLGVSAGLEIVLKPTRFFSTATRVLVSAMEEAQIKRLICVTGFGAGDSRGYGGFLYSAAFCLLLGRMYDDKSVQERIVRSSELDWVIVRPVILTNGPKTTTYRALVDPCGWTFGFISRANVANFLIKQIDDDAFLHKAPVLTS
jgi:uncharacterized protein YbjT (DUF2867 family)